MRRTLFLALTACILGIVLLAGLAFYIPRRLGRTDDGVQSEMFTGFQISTEKTGQKMLEEGSAPLNGLPLDTLPADQISQTEQAQTKQTQTKEMQTEQVQTEQLQELMAKQETAFTPLRHNSSLTASVPAHQIIWVGDSRTLGMRDALRKAERADGDFFVGKVGERVHWFQDEGMAELSDVIAEHPDLPVVMNFGVNDPQLINEYVVTYWDVIRDHPDTTFYILSVNPIDEEFLIADGQVNETVFVDVNSVNIGRMNVKLREEFGRRYINSAAFLKSDGYDTVDGLHFTMQTYLKIHDFVVNELF